MIYKNENNKKKLVTDNLQFKSLSPMFWLSFLSWKVYEQGVLSLHFHIKKHGHVGWANKNELTHNEI